MERCSLQDKVAVVTGGSRGIGEAIARSFAKAGAKLVVASHKLENVTAVAESIKAEGGMALAVATHMGDPEAIKALVRQAIEVFGGIDIVVNNAATNPHFGPLLTAEESVWDKILAVNLRGYFRMIREAVLSMTARGGGKVINIASIAGLIPMAGMALYGISKAAVIMMTRSLAAELAPHNIQVNAIAPGIIKTKFSQVIWDNEPLSSFAVSKTPARRLGTVDDLVGMALLLAGPASNFITGQVMVIDGGLMQASAMVQ